MHPSTRKLRVSSRQISALRIALFVLFSVPFFVLVYQAFVGGLGPDPAEKLADETGEWALRILLLTLAITPLRKLTGAIFLTQFRRMTGLFAYFYTIVHLLVFLCFFIYWEFAAIVGELVQRPYITVGFSSLLLLTPLAITSTKRWRQRLGKRWNTLHSLVYPAAALALLHLVWQVRSDWFEAVIYVGIFAVLVFLRLGFKRV